MDILEGGEHWYNLVGEKLPIPTGLRLVRLGPTMVIDRTIVVDSKVRLYLHSVP